MFRLLEMNISVLIGMITKDGKYLVVEKEFEDLIRRIEVYVKGGLAVAVGNWELDRHRREIW